MPEQYRLQRWPNIGPMPRVCWSNIKRGPDMDSIRGPPLDSQVGGGGRSIFEINNFGRTPEINK